MPRAKPAPPPTRRLQPVDPEPEQPATEEPEPLTPAADDEPTTQAIVASVRHAVRPRVNDESVHELAPARIVDLVRAGWYGDPGVGKTTAMATLANIGKVALWDAENRLKRSALIRAGVNVDNIERITDVSYTEVAAKLDALRERADEDPHFVGILFDGGTEMVRVMVQHLVDQGVKVAAKKGYERSEWRTYVEDYGDVAEQFRRLLRKALRVPVHFGMTTLSLRSEDENHKVRVTPQLTPAVARDFNSAMDVITFLRVDEVGDDVLRSGLFVPGGQHDAKDTFGVMPRRMANPSFERVLQYVNSNLTSDVDEQQEYAAQAVARARQAEAAKDE